MPKIESLDSREEIMIGMRTPETNSLVDSAEEITPKERAIVPLGERPAVHVKDEIILPKYVGRIHHLTFEEYRRMKLIVMLNIPHAYVNRRRLQRHP